MSVTPKKEFERNHGRIEYKYNRSCSKKKKVKKHKTIEKKKGMKNSPKSIIKDTERIPQNGEKRT